MIKLTFKMHDHTLNLAKQLAICKSTTTAYPAYRPKKSNFEINFTNPKIHIYFLKTHRSKVRPTKFRPDFSTWYHLMSS